MGIFMFNNLLSAVKTNGLSESFLPPMILNMSITASVIILFVLLARLALKKAPKIFSYALWAVVLFRLLCPVSITTDFSLLGLFDTPAVENTQHTTAVEYIPYDVVHTPDLEVQLPVPPAINDAVNDTLPQEHAALGADPLEGEFAIGSLIWLLGIAAMAIYSAVSYFLLRRKLVGSVLLRDNIYLADGIGSPFVMGFIRPKIYLPSALSEQEQSYIILHEQHHIRRGDHIIKALAFIALCIHWFNPLVWVAFVLSSKDMEMSCDEAVVKKLGEGIRADYSASLLSLATGRRIIAGTPLAFGEGDTKSRIKNMLKWKKPKTWIMLVALVACVVAIVFCATNPRNDVPEKDSMVAWELDQEYPDDVVDIVNDYVMQQVEYYNSLGSGENAIGGEYSITAAKVINLTNMVATGLADTKQSVELYRLEYRLRPSEPDHVVLAGGMQMEDGWITEWGSTGQPYLALLCDWSSGEEIWTKIGVTNTDVIDHEYNTDKMLSQYNDKYDAAAMEIYKTFLDNEPQENQLLSEFLKTLQYEDIGHMDWVMGDSITAKDVVTALNSAASNLVQHEPMNFGTTKFWSLDLFVGDPNATGWSGKDGIHLYAGLEENIVEISTGENLPRGPIWVESAELYSFVRHSSDYEEIIDEAAFAQFETILRSQMDKMLVSMSASLGDYTGYELTRFNRIWRYETQSGSIVELYDFNYALLPETIESIVWAGGMYLDSQLRVQGFNHGGPLAVKYDGNRVVATAFMANDFYYEPGDSENEAWAKEMINSALGIELETTVPTALPTETDIHNAIMANNSWTDSEAALYPYRTEAHHIWGTKWDGIRCAVYALGYRTTYEWGNGQPKRIYPEQVGSVEMVFEWDGKWNLTSFWAPPENEDSISAIRNRFPSDIAAIVLGEVDSDILADLNTRCHNAALQYYATLTDLPPAKTFTPADVNFSGKLLTSTPDEMTYEERLAWVQAGPDYQQFHFTPQGQYVEGNGCIAYLGQWVGTPHMNQYRLDFRFADGTTAHLPLPDDGGWGSVPPDTIAFQNGRFIYEMTFPSQEVTNEGETLVHIKGTYHYEVDLAAKTVSLTVLQ